MINLQDCHESSEPKFLRTEQAVGLNIPLPSFDIVKISQDHETPCHLLRVSSGNGESFKEDYELQDPANRRIDDAFRRHCERCYLKVNK